MTLVQSPTRAVFDAAAQLEIRLLTEENRAREALERLAQFDPQDREERIQFHGLRAKAQRIVGNTGDAVRDWVKALHLTSRLRPMRPRVRICLADTLAFDNDFARAERIIQRCVAEIRADGGHPLEPWALSSLAFLHMSRGAVGLAVRLYESAMALLPEDADLMLRVALSMNYSMALMRWGEYERAKEVQARVEGRAVEEGLLNLAPLFLSRSLLAMEAGDFDDAERALARADDRVVGDDARNRQIRMQIDVRLKLHRGRAQEALDQLDSPETLAILKAAPGDQVEEWRMRALALHDIGRAKEGLEAARIALRGCATDLLDRPAVLRVMARCLASLGQRGEAKERLATALSLLESTEFVMERRRLYEDMEALGMPVPVSKGARLRSAPAGRDASPEVHRFELADGRRFVTTESDLVARIHRAAESRLPVLLEGETGTGKELVARLLHEMSSARHGPLVVVDCTTLNDTLAEAELFGVARGAYTGAAADRQGLIGAADGGTVLFDELPELSLSAQSKLLRLLQEGTYRRLGEARARHVRVRVIAATNQDTERLLAQGSLKADLFFRLHGYRIRLRPLRDRPSDIALLAGEFAMKERLSGVKADALTELLESSWPGNARQLEMLIRAAAAGVPPGHWLDREQVARQLAEAPKMAAARSPERQRLKAALDSSGGNVAAAARALGMSRQGLYKALHRHGLM